MGSQSGTILRLQTAVLSQRSFATSAAALATELAMLFGCEHASIGILEHGYAKVVAVSGGSQFDPRQDAIARIAAAMEEAMEQGTLLAVPREGEPAPQITQANAALLTANDGGVCSVPLVNLNKVVGALTLERASAPFSTSETALCEEIACLVGPLLALKQDAERSALQRAGQTLRGFAARLADPGNRATKLAVSGAVLLLVGATIVPIPYRISAPAKLEGSIQRVLVAPADGFLQQVNARPGDLVREKQVLVELSGQDLAVEYRKRQSELLQHENAYQAALARADRTLLVINRAKAAEAEAQLALLENQIDRAQIRAPFDGVVIKGDLTQSLGAPVQRGEVLLTLSPSEQFRLIVEVDERDIAKVHPGQSGKLALSAMPYQTLPFVVGRVMPVATAGEGRNFFEVEARLDAPGVPLRPGLKGVAKLDAGNHALAWILTHRLLDWMRLSLWSLGL